MRFSAILTLFTLASLLSLAPKPAQSQDKPLTRSDQTLLDMAQAYKQGDRKKLSALLPQTRGHALEPWAAYWELSARLGEARTEEIEAFLQRWADSYHEDRLRAEWLALLGRQRDWATFRRVYTHYRMRDDRSLRCYALLADYLSGGPDPSDALGPLWLDIKDVEDGCASTAQALLDAANRPSLRLLVWQRARLAMEHERLRVLYQATDLISPKSRVALNQLYANPRKYLIAKLTALQSSTRELVVLALIRLATQDPSAAATELQKPRWRAQLTDEERSWVWGVIGKRAALRQDSAQAARYFAQGQADFMHEDHLAWQVRAALRSGRWAQALTALDAMAPGQQAQPVWTYWRAQAMEHYLGTETARAQARQALQSIAGVQGFYEQLALEALGQRITVPPPPAPLNAAEREQARANPGLQRGLYAIRIGLRAQGVREWNYSTNLHTKGGMDDRALLAAAALACQHEVWDRCINTSERTRTTIDFGQRFPMPFRDAVAQRCTQIGLDPAYVYGLIRQESRFILDAKSSVGANGLMQVMPTTARWTAKKIGLVGFAPHHIADRDTNIAIGTGYLKLVLDSFDGALPLAAAAYNAGPGRPRQWRGATGDPVVDGAIWAENIPFTETRDYVKKVLANTTSYAALLSGQPQSLNARLGRIGPRDATRPETGLDLP